MNARTRSLRGAAVAGFLASAALAVGAFGPWISLGLIHRSGLDATDDSYVQIAIAIVCAIATWTARYTGGRHAAWIILGGIISTAVAIYDLVQVGNKSVRILGSEVAPDPGWGLILCALAAVAMVFIGLSLSRATVEGEPTQTPADAGRVDQLEKLAALHGQGALTDEEFAREKALLLSGRLTTKSAPPPR